MGSSSNADQSKSSQKDKLRIKVKPVNNNRNAVKKSNATIPIRHGTRFEPTNIEPRPSSGATVQETPSSKGPIQRPPTIP
jgi:hypothetical protein